MRRAIGPFLATGVALAGAAVIAVNPVVPPPSDLQISASETAVQGAAPVDVLAPDFLKSIGLTDQAPLTVLRQLLVSLADGANDASRRALAGLSEVSARPPAADGTRSVAVGPSSAGQPPSHTAALPDDLGLGVLDEGLLDAIHVAADILIDANLGAEEFIADVFDVLVDIGTSLEIAGAKFIAQLELTPDIFAELAHQVESGAMQLDEALNRLALTALAVLTGHPALTGNEDIDRAFRTGTLQPVVATMTGRLSGPADTTLGNPTPGDSSADVPANAPPTVSTPGNATLAGTPASMPRARGTAGAPTSAPLQDTADHQDTAESLPPTAQPRTAVVERRSISSARITGASPRSEEGLVTADVDEITTETGRGASLSDIRPAKKFGPGSENPQPSRPDRATIRDISDQVTDSVGGIGTAVSRGSSGDHDRRPGDRAPSADTKEDSE